MSAPEEKHFVVCADQLHHEDSQSGVPDAVQAQSATLIAATCHEDCKLDLKKWSSECNTPFVVTYDLQSARDTQSSGFVALVVERMQYDEGDGHQEEHDRHPHLVEQLRSQQPLTVLRPLFQCVPAASLLATITSRCVPAYDDGVSSTLLSKLSQLRETVVDAAELARSYREACECVSGLPSAQLNFHLNSSFWYDSQIVFRGLASISTDPELCREVQQELSCCQCIPVPMPSRKHSDSRALDLTLAVPATCFTGIRREDFSTLLPCVCPSGFESVWTELGVRLFPDVSAWINAFRADTTRDSFSVVLRDKHQAALQGILATLMRDDGSEPMDLPLHDRANRLVNSSKIVWVDKIEWMHRCEKEERVRLMHEHTRSLLHEVVSLKMQLQFRTLFGIKLLSEFVKETVAVQESDDDRHTPQLTDQQREFQDFLGGPQLRAAVESIALRASDARRGAAENSTRAAQCLLETRLEDTLEAVGRGNWLNGQRGRRQREACIVYSGRGRHFVPILRIRQRLRS